MISKTLMKQTVKANIPLALIITAIQALCLVLIASTGQPVKITGQIFYSLLPGVLTSIYIIITGNKLLAAQVDKGSMAYILSTPVKRSKVALTQAVFFIGSLFVMSLITAATHIIPTAILNGSVSSSEWVDIIKFNFGLFLLALAYSGICFLASSIFNLSKNAIAVGGGIVGAFLLLSMMSMFGENFHFVKNFTITTLYNVNTIASGSSDYIWQFAVLAGIGLITYFSGIKIFSTRDLPL
ncbi:ABC transporter permease subunit [Psychrobacillus sp. NPDC096426]|uniref:ABC transporter permease subunit n=1 Tax=Psychrobacillus sp. NPDC096426 TaxID=3364491 RepID=UPI00382AB981